jgi:hypothetical protein
MQNDRGLRSDACHPKRPDPLGREGRSGLSAPIHPHHLWRRRVVHTQCHTVDLCTPPLPVFATQPVFGSRYNRTKSAQAHLQQNPPEGFKVLAKAELLTNLSWTPPTLVGTRLYIRDRKSLMAVDLG